MMRHALNTPTAAVGATLLATLALSGCGDDSTQASLITPTSHATAPTPSTTRTSRSRWTKRPSSSAGIARTTRAASTSRETRRTASGGATSSRRSTITRPRRMKPPIC